MSFRYYIYNHLKFLLKYHSSLVLSSNSAVSSVVNFNVLWLEGLALCEAMTLMVTELLVSRWNPTVSCRRGAKICENRVVKDLAAGKNG